MSNRWIMFVLAYPSNTRRRFNVVTTLLTSEQRCINVKTTSCAYWDMITRILMLELLSFFSFPCLNFILSLFGLFLFKIWRSSIFKNNKNKPSSSPCKVPFPYKRRRDCDVKIPRSRMAEHRSAITSAVKRRLRRSDVLEPGFLKNGYG